MGCSKMAAFESFVKPLDIVRKQKIDKLYNERHAAQNICFSRAIDSYRVVQKTRPLYIFPNI